MTLLGRATIVGDDDDGDHAAVGVGAPAFFQGLLLACGAPYPSPKKTVFFFFFQQHVHA